MVNMKNELKQYELMKYGEIFKIDYVAYNDGIWVNYRDISNYFGYDLTAYSMIWDTLKDKYKEMIDVDYTNQFGSIISNEERFIHISVILDLARRNDEISNNARNMVHDLENNTLLEGEVTETEAVNEFLEIWRNPNTTDVKITYNVIDEKTQQREERYKAWKKSGAKSTCPSWIRNIVK
jgi:hypothetical protein